MVNKLVGYFDLQVNGYAGVDFNGDQLTFEQLHDVCVKLRDSGVYHILATIITDDLDVMCARLNRIATLCDQHPLTREVIIGLHVEGPFINETAGYRGAHPADAIRPADVDVMQRLLDAGRGLVVLITLAPERDPNLAVTKWLSKRGIAVSAGHSDASLDDLRGAIDAGLCMFTHLGNGCPMQMHRHDNIIQRVLSVSDRLFVSFIADGAHVPFFALGNYLRHVGPERAVIVTDAIAPAGLGPGKYTLGRWQLDIGDDMVARAPDGSHLIGAAITMQQSAANLASHLGLSAEEIKQLTIINPSRAISANLRRASDHS